MKGIKSFIPSTVMAMIQSIVCIVIMVAIVLLSFGTIFTATVANSESANEKYNDIMGMFDMDEEEKEDLEMPKTVDVSAPFIVKSVSTVVKIIPDLVKMVTDAKDLVDDAQQMQDDVDEMQNASDLDGIQNSKNEVESSAKDLEDKANKTKESANKISDALKGEAFAGLIALIVIIVEAFGQSVILGIVYMALLVTAFTLPLVAIIKTLIAIISFCINIGDPGRGYAKVSKAFRGVFVMLPVLWLYKILAPQLTFGGAITGITVLCFAALGINLIASRLKSYTDGEFKYFNVLQIVSLVSVIGYVLFITNIGKIEMFDAIWDGIGDFLGGGYGAGAVIVTVLAVIIMVMSMFFVCKLISKLATRFCCMVPVGKKHMHDTYIVSGAMSLLLIIAPIVLMVGDFKLDIEDTMASFIVTAIGIVLIFASEVVLVVLKKTLCSDVTDEEILAVLTGCPTGEDDGSHKDKKVKEKKEKTVKTERANTEDVTEETSEEELSENDTTEEEEVVTEEAEQPTEELGEEVQEAAEEVVEEETEEAEQAEEEPVADKLSEEEVPENKEQ